MRTGREQTRNRYNRGLTPRLSTPPALWACKAGAKLTGHVVLLFCWRSENDVVLQRYDRGQKQYISFAERDRARQRE